MTIDTTCPKCGKGYGINTRKDKTIRCKLCGYEGPAMIPPKSVEDEIPSNTGETVLSG